MSSLKSLQKYFLVVSGPGIQDEQCIIENNDGFVVLDPFPKALCLVNDEIIHKRTRLQQGYFNFYFNQKSTLG